MHDPAQAASPRALVVDWDGAWAEECTALGIDRGDQPSALCLSGGGIRSAAFSLGVLQALADAGLLKHLHYLSTVSGGGYIGGWLTRLIAAQGDVEETVDLAAVETRLTTGAQASCDALHALRGYTRYLAPRPGFASPDLWAGVMLWLRNTLVNWLVFAPLLITLVALPFGYDGLIALTALRGGVSDPPMWIWVIAGLAGLAGLALFWWVVYRTILGLPTHSHPWDPEGKKPYGSSEGQVFWGIVAPAIAWFLLAPAIVAPTMNLHLAPVPVVASDPAAGAAPAKGSVTVGQVSVTVLVNAGEAAPPPAPAAAPAGSWAAWRWPLAVALGIFVASMAAYGLAFRRVLGWEYGTRRRYRILQKACFARNICPWFLASLVSSLLVALGIRLAAGADARWVVIAGPVWMMLAEVLRATLYVAFRRFALRGDLDREWLARLSGTKFVIVLAMAVVAALALLMPRIVLDGATSWLAVLGGGAASGSAAALLGKSARTAFAARRSDGTRWITPTALTGLAIVLFAAALVVAAAGFLDAVVRAVAAWLEASTTAPGQGPGVGGPASILLIAVCSGLGALLLAVYVGDAINLNDFSMHAVYRNRLVRGFLGSARPGKTRRPDLYAGFDPLDDLRMADAFNAGEPGGKPTTTPHRLKPTRKPSRLLPVVNVALNATDGADLARAARKAYAFTITPFRCGSGALGTRDGAGRAAGAYADTSRYAGQDREAGPGDKKKGISLGTAITLSGAAASPNMGYHSSALVAFVMTLFNVRLGAWLPNPGAPGAAERMLRRPDPDGIGPLLWDLLGKSGIGDRYVYLSDGGHFDNLGLYEMLRRRCRLMIVVDADQDNSYGYADLRTAIQNASIDLGVRLTFPKSLAIGRDALDPVGTVAQVAYPAVAGSGATARGAEDGVILYLKPWLADDSPTELRAFKALKPSFPHESTGNQFFDESDFESYRALGAFIGTRALAGYLARNRQDRTIGTEEPDPLARLGSFLVNRR